MSATPVTAIRIDNELKRQVKELLDAAGSNLTEEITAHLQSLVNGSPVVPAGMGAQSGLVDPVAEYCHGLEGAQGACKKLNSSKSRAAARLAHWGELIEIDRRYGL